METVRFGKLQLDGRVIHAITEVGFEEASSIQAQAIPVTMKGRGMIGQTQTGTGKTAAFGLPLLQKVDPKMKRLQAIVLLPTRELAVQVAEETHRFAEFMYGMKVLPIYGGQDIVKQIRSLKDGTQVIVGTPGRVIDHMRRKIVKVNYIFTVVLDEADEMLNMSFLEDMETILSQLPGERQTLMFSATIPQAIAEIARKFQKDPVAVRVIRKELTMPKVTQYYYEVRPKNKVEVVSRLLGMYAPKLSIMFCNIKRQMGDLVQELQGRGYFTKGLHGDLKQVQRDRVMDSLRNGRIDVLVAMDVATEGINVGGVEAVFNYDTSQDDEHYVHHIGRTGRTGREGKAFSLVMGKEVYELRDIQRYCKTKIVPQTIPSLSDITKIRAEKILDRIQETLDGTDLTKMVNIIKKELVEEDCTSMDLAAALLKMSMGDESKDVINSFETVHSLDGLGSFGRGGSHDRSRKRSAYGNRRKGATDRTAVDYVLGEGDEKMTGLFVDIGEAQRITPGDILGTIARKSGIPGRMVGSIDMYDGYAFVDVPGHYTDDVLKAMVHAKIKGENIYVEKANTNKR